MQHGRRGNISAQAGQLALGPLRRRCMQCCICVCVCVCVCVRVRMDAYHRHNCPSFCFGHSPKGSGICHQQPGPCKCEQKRSARGNKHARFPHALSQACAASDFRLFCRGSHVLMGHVGLTSKVMSSNTRPSSSSLSMSGEGHRTTVLQPKSPYVSSKGMRYHIGSAAGRSSGILLMKSSDHAEQHQAGSFQLIFSLDWKVRADDLTSQGYQQVWALA